MLPSLGKAGRRSAGTLLRGASTAADLTASSQRPLMSASTTRLPASITPSWTCRSCRSRFFSNTVPAAGSSSSNTRWQARQSNDMYAREAKVRGLKSRAAFKLLEIDQKHRLFKPNQTIVDLGYAPGSWSQVAVERTKPHGRVVGIDLIPAQPPRGVSTIQGNFLSPAVRQMVKELLAQPPVSPKTTAVSRPKPRELDEEDEKDENALDEDDNSPNDGTDPSGSAAPAIPEAPNDTVAVDRLSYLESERQATASAPVHDTLVDIVLSDMMMNTSGNAFRDHAGSMDLCYAALEFASDTLRTGGHFVCKFYQGGEDKALEMRLKKMFTKVVREKPGSSRSESKESFFVAIRKKKGVKWNDIKDM